MSKRERWSQGAIFLVLLQGCGAAPSGSITPPSDAGGIDADASAADHPTIEGSLDSGAAVPISPVDAGPAEDAAFGADARTGRDGGGRTDGGTPRQDAGAGPGSDGGFFAGPGPRGIYVLGRVDAPPPALPYDFLTGATLRLSWKATEPVPGQYDFSVVDQAIAALLPLNQKLTIEVMAVSCPQFVIDAAAETWSSAADGQPAELLPVPWDESAQVSWSRYMRALSDHLVANADGTPVKLSEHPTLETVDAPVVGLQGLRDQSGHLTAEPSYSRATFIAAVVRSVHSTRDVFPNKFGFLGVFGMSDADRTKSLSDDVIDQLNTEFNNPGQLTLGYFQELLSDAGPPPTGNLGKILLRSASKTYILFQALTAWTAPFTGPDKVTSGDPNTGLDFAYENFGARYVELYVPDVNTQAFWPDFRAWTARVKD